MASGGKRIGKSIPSSAVAVTAANADLAGGPATHLYIGSATATTHVQVKLTDGSIVLLKNIAPGVWHEMAIIQVQSTNTTATDIVVGYA